jgi:hypothetical protein
MLTKLFNWLMIGATVALVPMLLMIYGEVFRAHITLFLILWFFIPMLAIWFNVKSVRMELQISSAGLSSVRMLLTCLVYLISFAFFAHHKEILDTVGYQFIDGYYVSYEGVGTATHWYSRFGLWLIEWLFFLLCVMLPFVTWIAGTRAVEASNRDKAC